MQIEIIKALEQWVKVVRPSDGQPVGQSDGMKKQKFRDKNQEARPEKHKKKTRNSDFPASCSVVVVLLIQ